MNRTAKHAFFVGMAALVLSHQLAIGATCLPTVTVTPAIGPNFGSPSFGGFASNFMDFLFAGTPGPDYNLDPTGFLQPVPNPLQPNEVIVTGFNSWRGQGDPTPGWDGPMGQFANELGNRIYFGLSIESPSHCNADVTARGISGKIEWQDSGGAPSPALATPTTTFDFAAEMRNYDAFRWGVDMSGALHNDVMNPGTVGTTPMRDIYYLGASTAIEEDSGGTGMLTDQEILDKTITAILEDFNNGDLIEAVVDYNIVTGLGKMVDGTGTVTLPEPNGWLPAIMAACLFLAGTRGRLGIH